MGKHVTWIGFGVRVAYDKTWTSGVVHWIEDDEQALDLLTQPGERFEEADDPHPSPLVKKPLRVPEGEGANALVLTDVEGIGAKRAAELAGAGIDSVEALAGLLGDYVALQAALEQLTGVSEATLLNWSRAAGELLAKE